MSRSPAIQALENGIFLWWMALLISYGNSPSGNQSAEYILFSNGTPEDSITSGRMVEGSSPHGDCRFLSRVKQVVMCNTCNAHIYARAPLVDGELPYKENSYKFTKLFYIC